MARSKKTPASRSLEELALLYRIGQTLDHNLDLREVAGPVLEALAEQMGMTRGTLTLLNRQIGQIMIEAAHGLSPEQMKRGPGCGTIKCIESSGGARRPLRPFPLRRGGEAGEESPSSIGHGGG